MGFTHLHLHTEFSLLDGAIKIKRLAQYLKKNNFDACAITDHGNMHGVLTFYNEMRAEGIKPIIGTEFYLNPEDNRISETNNFHMTVLAKNFQGYQNLSLLSSLSYQRDEKRRHFYRKPRITFQDLQEHHEGLVVLSGCLGGSLAQFVVNDRIDLAKEYITEKFIPLFGEDFYIEIMRHGIDDEETALKGLRELSKEFSIPMVATNDAHYLTREEGIFHNILLSIQMKRDFSDKINDLGQKPTEADIMRVIKAFDRSLGPEPEFYVKTEEEMRKTFAEFQEAVDITSDIADKCNLELPSDRPWAMPAYDLPAGYAENGASAGYSKLLREICEDSIKVKYKGASRDKLNEVQERFEHEFKIISEKNFAQYFLIVRDFIIFAHDSDIPIGPGRGSVVGSLVAYLSDLIEVDPLEYDLLFERFLNPERTSLPDVDLDVCQASRDILIQHIRDSYNKGSAKLEEQHVCQIATFQVMKTKQVIRDTGRVLGIPLSLVDKVSKLISGTGEAELEDALKVDPAIGRVFDETSLTKLWLKASKSLKDLVRNNSIHAAGVVISDKPLVEYTPLFYSSNGDLVSQFQMTDIENAKLVKWDILGLKTLTVLHEASKLINKDRSDFVLNEVSFDDKKTYEMLASGDVQGVFQMESSTGMANVIKRINPQRLTDIIGAGALFRPGPLRAGLADKYIENKRMWEAGDSAKVKSAIPFDLGDILDDAYGTMIFQEHIMRISQRLCGFSPVEADVLRKAVAKKKGDTLMKMKSQFIQGAIDNGASKKDVEELWEQIEKFAEYAFNKSHATAYAYLSYWTAYLKANYPVEFFTALINKEKDFEKKNVYYENAFHFSIDILPPDVSRSFNDFTPEGENIRYGMGHIKGVSSKFIADLVEEREQNGLFSDIFDLMKRVPHDNLNRGNLETLIKVGAFDSLGVNRSTLSDGIEKIIEYGKKVRQQEASRQMTLFSSGSGSIDPYADLKNLKRVEDFETTDKLRYEKEFLGYYFSSHPISQYQHYFDWFPVKEIMSVGELADREEVHIVGVLTKVKKCFNKRKEIYLKFIVEDLSGSVTLNIYHRNYRELSDQHGMELKEYFDQLIYTPMIFLVGRGLVEGERTCRRFYQVEEIWGLFDKGVLISIPHDDLKKVTNNIGALKSFFEKHQGPLPVKVEIENTPIYGKITIDFEKKYGLKISKEVYEDFKNNFPDLNITAI
ncbi:DNA polymerase III subunit alpha [bacterium]|nr:DNA polymerase III subunit alpha [bacterium]